MARLLYIEASPRKEKSTSTAVAQEFIETYRQVHRGDKIETADVWRMPLPEFDGEVLNARYALHRGHALTHKQKQTWRSVENLIAQFTAADSYLFSLPMWNFNIPYKLKHYIDLVVQPGCTFSFSPAEGFRGLVTGRPAAAIYSRAGAYGPDSGMADYDLQKGYLEKVLKFIGFNEIHAVVIEETLGSHAVKERNVAAAIGEARRIAEEFGNWSRDANAA